MKNTYEIKDKVWIHISEPDLVEGRIVEIIDLDHLNEGHSPNEVLYIIEIPSSIEPVYEVRTYEQISSGPSEPINLYKSLGHNAVTANRALKKVGLVLPENVMHHANNFADSEVTPKQNRFKKKFRRKHR